MERPGPEGRPGRCRACRPRRASGHSRRHRTARAARTARSARGRLDSLEGLDGLSCHAGGQSGTVALSYDASGHAVLTCVAGGGGSASTGIKINEFSTGVTGAATDEFVEIVNAGTTAADIGGVKVVYRSATGSADTTLNTVPAGTMLAAGAFYLLGGSGYAGTAPADQSFGISLAGGGGSVGVRDAGGALLDAVAYGTAANGLGEGQPTPAPPTTAGPGSSAIRLPDGRDTDNNATDFAITAAPTPRASNVAG